MLYCCFLILLISNYIVNTIAVPIHQQTSFQITSSSSNIKTIPLSYVISKENTINRLEEFYGEIVQDIVNVAIQEIIDVAPDTFQTIHELQYSGKENCRTSLSHFMTALKYHLDQHVRESLPVSIKPLLENEHQHKDIIQLNQYMSQQLGAIINPSYLTQQIIQETYSHNEKEQSSPIARIWKIISDRQWYLTLRHELNESRALESWLHAWLVDIEYSLKDEFDSKLSSEL